MIKGFILATLVSLSIIAIWYVLEYIQFGQTRYVCPICRKFYEGTDYCPKCGQALKLGEEE